MIQEKYDPVRLSMAWGSGNDAKAYCINLPWDADADAFAIAFQSMMAAFGFCEDTIKDYVSSSYMGKAEDNDKL